MKRIRDSVGFSADRFRNGNLEFVKAEEGREYLFGDVDEDLDDLALFLEAFFVDFVSHGHENVLQYIDEVFLIESISGIISVSFIWPLKLKISFYFTPLVINLLFPLFWNSFIAWLKHTMRFPLIFSKFERKLLPVPSSRYTPSFRNVFSLAVWLPWKS